jgi:ribosomal protein L35
MPDFFRQSVIERNQIPTFIAGDGLVGGHTKSMVRFQITGNSKLCEKQNHLHTPPQLHKLKNESPAQQMHKKNDPRFKPELTPKKMLELGIFGGLYFSDKPKEFPKDWFENAKLSPDGKEHKELNYFKVKASLPLKVWQTKGWIHPQDPRGWLQWYFRYYLGRRTDDDERQIKRWLAMRRHIAQIKKNCPNNDISCRPKQRQALLHWAYDSRKI